MGFIRKFLIWVMLIPALILGALLVIPQFMGLQVCSVHTDDMPDYPSGALLYVRYEDPSMLETGDVITYMVSQTEVRTHRIAGVVAEEGNPSEIRFRTKGDTKAGEDPTLVYYRNVLGVPVMAIPVLGYAADFFATTAGLCSAVAAGIVWLLLVLMPLFSHKKKPATGGRYLK